MKIFKVFVLIFVLAVAALAAFALKTCRDAGEFKKLVPHSVLSCRAVEGVLSSEDITVDPRTGIAFISSGIRGINVGAERDRGGAVFGYDLNSDNPSLINMTKDFKEELFPHGIGLYSAPGGGTSLFVVNHRHDNDYIEIFDFDGTKLVHRRSVSGDMMHNPNDVIPVGPDKFYVTNDHGYRSFNGQLIEDFLQLPKAYVLYFDSSEFHVVAEGLNYSNGVNISADGKTVYVAETIGRRVRIYNRDIDTGALTLRDTINLDTGADNIDVDADGNLWIAGHPKLLTFVKHARDNSLPSPSQVLRVAVSGDNAGRADEMHLEDGTTLPGSSVAATYKDKVLIGGVFATRFLVCDIQK